MAYVRSAVMTCGIARTLVPSAALRRTPTTSNLIQLPPPPAPPPPPQLSPREFRANLHPPHAYRITCRPATAKKEVRRAKPPPRPTRARLRRDVVAARPCYKKLQPATS